MYRDGCTCNAHMIEDRLEALVRLWYAVLIFKFTFLGCREFWIIVATSGDVGSGVADCDLQNIWNPRKNCGSFVIVGLLKISPTLVFSIT